jgi:hypothetical protein
MEITAEAYIEHFGVKGMKWGVRRERRIEKNTAELMKEHGWQEPRARRAAVEQEKLKRIGRVTTGLSVGLLLAKVGSRYVREMRYGAIIERARNSGDTTVDDQLRDMGRDPNWRGSDSTRVINETLIAASKGRDYVRTRMHTPKSLRDIPRRINIDDAIDVYSNTAGAVNIRGALGA